MSPLQAILVTVGTGALIGGCFVGIQPSSTEMLKHCRGNTPWKRRLDAITTGVIAGGLLGTSLAGVSWVGYVLYNASEISPDMRTVTVNFGLSVALFAGVLTAIWTRNLGDDAPRGFKALLVFVYTLFGLGIGGTIAVVLASLSIFLG